MRRRAGLAILAALFASPATSKASAKCPSTVATGSGPVYKFGTPDKTKASLVCAPSGSKGARYTRINPASCFGPVCLLRKSVDLGGREPRLHVEGTLKDESCKGLPHAAIDLWQADSTGRYGSLHPNDEDDFCRAVIETDRHGHFKFDTDLPGAYGLGSGQLPFGMDLPPYAPQHIHVLIAHPGFPVYSTQLYLSDDAGRGHDWRERLVHSANETLGAMEPSVSVNIKNCTRGGVDMHCATVELVLPAHIPGAQTVPAGASKQARERSILETVCIQSAAPLPLCHPVALNYMRVKYLVPALLVVLALAFSPLFLLLRALCKGRSGGGAPKAKMS